MDSRYVMLDTRHNNPHTTDTNELSSYHTVNSYLDIMLPHVLSHTGIIISLNSFLSVLTDDKIKVSLLCLLC